MGKYKSFKDGLFRVGDIVNVTIKSHGRGAEPRMFCNLTIETIDKRNLYCYQQVVDAIGAGEVQKMQYLTFSLSEVIEVTPLRSEAWRNEYAPASPGIRERRPRNRRPRMEDFADDPPFLEDDYEISPLLEQTSMNIPEDMRPPNGPSSISSTASAGALNYAWSHIADYNIPTGNTEQWWSEFNHLLAAYEAGEGRDDG